MGQAEARGHWGDGAVEGRRARRRGVRASERGVVDNLITKAS